MVTTAPPGALHFLTSDRVGPGGLVVPSDPLPALLRSAQVYIDAARNGGSGVNEGTGGSALDLAGVFGVVEPWAGDALSGYMTLDGGYDDAGSWFTDLDITLRFACPPLNDNNPARNWAEVFHIPVTGGGGATEWIEVGPVFTDDGAIAFGLDFESGSETGGPTWLSDEIGRWDDGDGIPMTTWRLTVVAATGAITLYRDGVEETTDTFGGAVALPEPTSGETVQVGPFQYPVVVESVSLKDGIGGAEIIGWDASDTTGWTTARGNVGSAPTHPFFLCGGSNAFTIADSAALTLPAGTSATMAFYGPCPVGLHAWTHFTGGSVPGVAIVPGNFVGGSGSDLVAALSAGGAPTVATIGTPAAGDEILVVVTIDRDSDEMIGWLNGADGGPADISGVGAVNPSDAMAFVGPFFKVLRWDRVLTDTEITVDLPAALGVS